MNSKLSSSEGSRSSREQRKENEGKDITLRVKWVIVRTNPAPMTSRELIIAAKV